MSKTVFTVQYLISRSSAGIVLQVSVTTFASNFERFAAERLAPRVESPRYRFREMPGRVIGPEPLRVRASELIETAHRMRNQLTCFFAPRAESSY